jgi:hypothetical protein
LRLERETGSLGASSGQGMEAGLKGDHGQENRRKNP